MTVRAFRTWILWMAVGFLIPMATAQSKGTTTAGGTGTAGTSATRTSSTPAAAGNTSTTTNPAQPAPIFLSGRVMLEEGTPPPAPVRIERVCGASTHTEGFTD
ncbi:MAG: hypothetical protein ABSH45_20665, partial [Bryobacteraceae bacterium]